MVPVAAAAVVAPVLGQRRQGFIDADPGIAFADITP
jgi:hypothetical protein